MEDKIRRYVDDLFAETAPTRKAVELKEATLYTAFRRLQQAGCITSYWGDEQTGARRRYYSITETGRDTYSELIDEWKMAKDTIDKLIETGGKQ